MEILGLPTLKYCCFAINNCESENSIHSATLCTTLRFRDFAPQVV